MNFSSRVSKLEELIDWYFDALSMTDSPKKLLAIQIKITEYAKNYYLLTGNYYRRKVTVKPEDYEK